MGSTSQQLLFDPRSPDTVYVSCALVGGPGLYRSTDGGATWQNITGELADAERLSLVIDSAPGGGLYAVTERGLFKWVPGRE